MFLIAHLSDCHLDGTPRTRARLDRVLTHLDGLSRRPDLVLLSGDLADHGLAGEYAELVEAVADRSPVVVCPGNHDDRSAMRAAGLPGLEQVADDTATAPIRQVHQVGAATIVLLDTSIPGKDEGALTDDDLAWLRARLGEVPAGSPALLAMHHPPLPLGHPAVDAIRLQDSERLAAVLADFPDVVAVLTGHAHTAMATTFAGRPQVGAPGIVSTLRMPWEQDDAPENANADRDAAIGLAFHLIDDDHRLTSHFRFFA